MAGYGLEQEIWNFPARRAALGKGEGVPWTKPEDDG